MMNRMSTRSMPAAAACAAAAFSCAAGNTAMILDAAVAASIFVTVLVLALGIVSISLITLISLLAALCYPVRLKR